ncbi:MAG: MFS transporter [Acidobacteria bacterium]|nr:MAG: MFS transporter [Acidobacteriota bacterium]PYX46970.1 MAG: MFS transporter [Acidobacteriota bacterium]
MAASTIPVRPSAVEIARAAAAAIPSEVSTRPLLGILGVVTGAGLVTLAGRMLSLGLADLKGHVGIGFDNGAWLDSAYNASLMFIGPFSVYLGGLLGPRRILLFAAGLFTVTSIFLPFIHSYSLLVVALIVAGLTSGTFYPLTLTFALRNIPLRYLPFTIALYATFVDGAVNIAPSLYGWYRDHLSWHWMFWNSAVIAPVMMICVYFGIPRMPSRKKGGPAPSFVGFLYLSAGLALVFAALQQGQRLEWWRSGEFNAWFWSGSFFLLCALVRRLRAPNPLVALRYLLKWNTVLLGCLLFWFRFTLCTTIILIPQSLAIRGLEADQIGPAIIWSALPLIPIAFIAALLLLRKHDPRLLFAIGLACTAFAAWLNSQYTSAWAAENLYRTELLTGLGQAFAFIGLVGCIVLQAIFAGALAKPEWVLSFSAFFHTIRLFGGTAGAIYMGHFIAQREKLHSELLGLHVSSGNWISDQNIHAMTAGLFAKSSSMAAAGARAIDLIAARLRLQAYSLSLVDGFLLIAWSCACALIFVALLRKSPLNYGELSNMQQIPAAHKESNQ